ncbi:MAG: cupin domain-containing protein [Desulfovibrio sp.]|jgi:predicted cupin superfamily sugar epimerase
MTFKSTNHRGALPEDPEIDAIVRALGLVPLPQEGGLYAETYRSARILPAFAAGPEQAGPRVCATAIYYLVTPTRFSALHRVASTEIFHFYLGDPVRMLQLHPDGSASTHIIGTDILSGARPQVVAPRGSWQGTRLAPGGRFALLGCTVSPGFDFADYEHGSRAELVRQYPAWAEEIAALTPGE